MNKHLLLCFCLLCLALSSCSSDEDLQAVDKEDGECVNVTLSFGGDLDIQSEPLLSRASSSTNDVYGINIYYDKNKDDVYTIYGYGLFDNVDDMTVTLLSGHKYKFECSLVKNAKNTLYYGKAFGNSFNGYAYPFQLGVSKTTMVTNSFAIGGTDYLIGLKKGTSHIAGVTPSSSNAIDYPSTNRFYGEVSDYTPIVGGVVNINLKRVVFGAKINISGVVDGTASVTCGEFFSLSTQTDVDGQETIYTFYDVYDCWKNETPYNTTITLNYVSDRGDDWNLTKTYNVSFKRNIMSVININISPDLSDAQLNLVEENWGEDNVINLGIGSDGLIDIIVSPNE